MRILLISCGGTIASPSKEGSDRAGETAMENAAEVLLHSIATKAFRNSLELRAERLPGGETSHISQVDLYTMDLLNKDSTEVGPTDWTIIIDTIIGRYDGFHGFIITHGTNSLAYTSSALTFGLPRLGKPIVMTGSNTPIGVPQSDAIVNVANSVLLVQKLVAEERRGVFVVFASRIIPGVRAKKANGTELEAFRTFNASDLGQMRSKEILFSTTEYEKYIPQHIPTSPWYDVPIAESSEALRRNAATMFAGVISSHTFHPGDNPRTYRAVLRELVEMRDQLGLSGALIIRAVGDGDLSKLMQLEVLEYALNEQIPVVITTQEPQGTSSFRGNDQSAEAERLGLAAWDMSIETMVVKLRYLLGMHKTYEEMRREFGLSYFGEINTRT